MTEKIIERMSPNVLVVIVAVAITLMQLGSAYWVRETTAAQRKLDIEAAITAHTKDANPHNSDLGKQLDATQRTVVQRLTVVEVINMEQAGRMDRMQTQMLELQKELARRGR